VNRGFYTRIMKALDEAAKARLDHLFTRVNEGGRTAWDLIKSEPRQPSAKEIKRFVAHLNWLREQAGDLNPLAGIPVVKVNRFAAEARALEPTTQDDSVHKAIVFVLANKASRAELLPVGEGAPGSGRKNSALNLSFIPEPWWTLVTRTKNRSVEPTHVNRQFFELCVLSQVATDLKANDLCIPLGTKLGDYRERLVSWDTYHREIITYGERMNIPVQPQDFVARLRVDLDKTTRTADQKFPDNRYLRIENGEPVLSPVRADPDPAGLSRMEQLLKESMEPVEILDALVDTEHWLNWTRYFGPLSGFDAKVKRPRERYVLTVFCYGSNLGPVQTARSVSGTDRFKLAFVNQRHVTEASLNDAITTVVNAYAQFPLQRLWGTGKSAKSGTGRSMSALAAGGHNTKVCFANLVQARRVELLELQTVNGPARSRVKRSCWFRFTMWVPASKRRRFPAQFRDRFRSLSNVNRLGSKSASKNGCSGRREHRIVEWRLDAKTCDHAHSK
jgi:Tn3 transposase DDE domain